MKLITIILINIILIPVTAGIDWLAFHKRLEEEYGHPPKWHYFLPACFLELMFLNAGILVGLSL